MGSQTFYISTELRELEAWLNAMDKGEKSKTICDALIAFRPELIDDKIETLEKDLEIWKMRRKIMEEKKNQPSISGDDKDWLMEKVRHIASTHNNYNKEDEEKGVSQWAAAPAPAKKLKDHGISHDDFMEAYRDYIKEGDKR